MLILTAILGPFLLIALGVGYLVWYLANKAQDNLRKVGYIIGIFIIAVSCLLIIATLVLDSIIGKFTKGVFQSRAPATFQPYIPPAPK